MSNGKTVERISDLYVGDIVRHKARKTLNFKITKRLGRTSLAMQRCDMAGNVDSRYKGYRIGPSDVSKGYITLVKKVDETSAPEIEFTEAPVKKQVTQGVTVDQLEEKDILRSHVNIIAEFRRLEAQLSPENLTCDGEASANQVAFLKKQIMDKWALLEAYVGQKVEPVV